MKSIELNNKRTINAWAMFDWANSSYALVIAVAIFPIYFNQYVDPEFKFLGFDMTSSALFSYALSFAYLLIAIALPLLSGMADHGGKKKLFMQMFTTIGSIACISMYWFEGHAQLALGLVGFILAVIGFAGGQVFYNSYLPLIASEDQYDRVSAKGFAFGYVGSVLLLVANLVMIQKPEWFGLADGKIASRISFVMVGLWWIGFAQITFNRLPKEESGIPLKGLVRKGYNEIKNVWKIIKQKKNIKNFLFAFFFYSAGVQTVIYLASTFASEELNFGTADLITVILLLQLVAIGGAYLFAFLAERMGNKISILVMLVIWSLVCVAAYFVTEKGLFYAVASAVGLVMGGIQSVSRSSYSKLIPENTTDTASYFSFYDVLEKIAIVLGTFSFGFINQISGGMRNSILVLILYFIIGILILLSVKFEKKKSLA